MKIQKPYPVTMRLNKQIAGELGLAEITVKIHRGHIMKKMGARSLRASKNGLPLVRTYTGVPLSVLVLYTKSRNG
jgi:hypothetical protein